MARVTVEDCLGFVHNRFALVLLVAKRSKQLVKGSKLTVPSKNNKFIVSALREVAAGKVAFASDTARGSAEHQIEDDLNRHRTV